MLSFKDANANMAVGDAELMVHVKMKIENSDLPGEAQREHPTVQCDFFFSWSLGKKVQLRFS